MPGSYSGQQKVKLLILPSSSTNREEAEHNSIKTLKDRAASTVMTEKRNSTQVD